MTTTLTLPEGLCTFSRGALVFTRVPTQDEWEQIGRYVHAARGSSLRWMADWRSEGRRQFGDEIVEQVQKHLQMEFKDLKAMEALEALEVRSDALSDEHHIALAKSLPSDGLAAAREEWANNAVHWFKVAEEEKLTPRELQKSIRAGQIVRDTPAAKTGTGSAGLLTLESIHMDFLRWKSRAEDDGFPLEWDERQLQRVLDLLAPMREAAQLSTQQLAQKNLQP